MSRVIKSVKWHDTPKIVDVPALFIKSSAKADDAPVALLPEVQLMLFQAREDRVKRMLADAETERCNIIIAAKNEADAILAAAKTASSAVSDEARETGRQAGWEAGWEAGYEAGLQAAQAEQKEAVAAANQKAEQTVAAAQQEMQHCLLQAERQLVEMTMKIIGKVLPQHFIDVPQVILPLVRKALEKVKDQNSIVIRVSPDNYQFVLMAKNEYQAMIEGNEPIQIKADESLGSGDCVIESMNGSVDARLATQLDIIKKSMQEVME